MSRRLNTVWLALTAFAAQIEGTYVGDWSGSSGASGTFHLAVAAAEGKPRCEVTFGLGAAEVKTRITLCEVEGAKIRAKYEFELQSNKQESTIAGELKGDTLEGKYSTKLEYRCR